jgi:hypothetical protein
MADYLTDTRNGIAARMDELRPAVEEYMELEAAQTALASVNGAASVPQAAAPARAARSATRTKGTGKRGRPKGSGTRRAEALAIITATPGITVAQIAEAMNIRPNYLYRVVPALAQEGAIERAGNGWKAVA